MAGVDDHAVDADAVDDRADTATGGAVTSGPEDALAAALAASGSRFAFGLPGGGSNLAMVGALERHGLSFVLQHTETAACIAAATYGYVSGSVSAAVVTRGPGAASAVNGAAQATLDRHPLVLISDTVAADQRARIAHQRIDQQSMLAPVTKATGPLTLSNGAAAVDLAATSPAGAVHLDQDPTEREPSITAVAPRHQPDTATLSLARRLIAEATKPIVTPVAVAHPTSSSRRLRSGPGAGSGSGPWLSSMSRSKTPG